MAVVAEAKEVVEEEEVPMVIAMTVVEEAKEASGGGGGGGSYGDSSYDSSSRDQRNGGEGGGGPHSGGEGGGQDYTRDTLRDNSNVDESSINTFLLEDRMNAKKTRDFDTADAIHDQLMNAYSVGVFDCELTWRTGCSPSGIGRKFGGGGDGGRGKQVRSLCAPPRGVALALLSGIFCRS
jgi:hypothetical protein